MMKDGRLNKCIECAKADVRRHRRLNDSVREYDRKRGKIRNGKPYRPRREYAGAKIQDSVQRAMKNGLLRREPCLFCASDTKVQAHHPDYTKPLMVVWLCPKCHSRLHSVMEMYA
jgi:hypothetical protein